MKKIALVLSGILFAACLADAYVSRIARFATASTLASQLDADVPYIRTDTLAKNPPPFGRGWISIQRPIDGDLVYSHYTHSAVCTLTGGGGAT